MAKTKKSERFDAIYARQSVDKRDSVSIEAQIDDCKVKCSGKIRVYKDKGYSGKNIERPDLQRLMDDIKTDDRKARIDDVETSPAETDGGPLF